VAAIALLARMSIASGSRDVLSKLDEAAKFIRAELVSAARLRHRFDGSA
jgi:hypothetical protein